MEETNGKSSSSHLHDRRGPRGQEPYTCARAGSRRGDRGVGRSRGRRPGRDRRRVWHRGPFRLPRRGAGQGRVRRGDHHHADLHPPGSRSDGRGARQTRLPREADGAEPGGVRRDHRGGAAGRRDPADRVHAPFLAGIRRGGAPDRGRRDRPADDDQVADPRAGPAARLGARSAHLQRHAGRGEFPRLGHHPLADGLEPRTGLHGGREFQRPGPRRRYAQLLRQRPGQHPLRIGRAGHDLRHLPVRLRLRCPG